MSARQLVSAVPANLKGESQPEAQLVQPEPLPWLDVRRAAARALVSQATILRELRAGRLVGYRVGSRKCWRIRPEAVDAWLTQSREPRGQG